MADLYLASKSPRRFELLQQLGLQPEIIHIDVDESIQPGEKPHDYVLRVSKEKALSGWQNAHRTKQQAVLSCDTAVIVNGQILGKPDDFEHACEMWRCLSGQEHQVLSAVAVQQGQRQVAAVQTSTVHMCQINEQQMRAYWDTGEPQDKAGAYAVQGLAAIFIEKISGSYSGIMGLPLFETAQILKEFGFNLLTLEQKSSTSKV